MPLVLHGVSLAVVSFQRRADLESRHQSIAPPQMPTNIIIPGFLVSFASQFYALRNRPRWFEKVGRGRGSLFDCNC